MTQDHGTPHDVLLAQFRERVRVLARRVDELGRHL
jgi:hypothetical protein